MSTKTTSRKPALRYAPEDLAPRDIAGDEKFANDFIARNRDAINADLKTARASIKKGKGKRYRSSEDLVVDIMGKVRRPSRKA